MPADIVWEVVTVSGNQIGLVMTGNFAGLVLNGLPGFYINGGYPVVSSYGAISDGPGANQKSVTLTFNDVIPATSTLYLPNGDLWLRNRVGGKLSSGVWQIQPTNPAPVPVYVDACTPNGAGVDLQMDTASGLHYAYNDYATGWQIPPVLNETTMENPSFADWQTGTGPGGTDILVLNFPSGAPSSGDTISLAAEDNSVISQTGGLMQPFSFVMP